MKYFFLRPISYPLAVPKRPQAFDIHWVIGKDAFVAFPTIFSLSLFRAARSCST